MKIKEAIVILIILLLAAVAAIPSAVHYWKLEEIEKTDQVSDQTINHIGDWSIYRNEMLGFEITYPSDLFELTETSKYVILSYKVPDSNGCGEKVSSDIHPSGDLFAILFGKTIGREKEICNRAENEEVIKTFRYESVKGFYYEGGTDVSEINYCIEDNNGNDILLLKNLYSRCNNLSQLPDYTHLRSHFDKILSTFRFIK